MIFKIVGKSHGYIKLAPISLFVYLGFIILEEIFWKFYISAAALKHSLRSGYSSPKLCFASLGTSVSLPSWENLKASAFSPA